MLSVRRDDRGRWPTYRASPRDGRAWPPPTSAAVRVGVGTGEVGLTHRHRMRAGGREVGGAGEGTTTPVVQPAPGLKVASAADHRGHPRPCGSPPAPSRTGNCRYGFPGEVLGRRVPAAECCGEVREAGHDAVHVVDSGLAGSPDDEVIRRAAVEQRVLVSLDTDFGEILANSANRGPSVVLFRRPSRRAAELAELRYKLSSGTRRADRRNLRSAGRRPAALRDCYGFDSI